MSNELRGIRGFFRPINNNQNARPAPAAPPAQVAPPAQGTAPDPLVDIVIHPDHRRNFSTTQAALSATQQAINDNRIDLTADEGYAFWTDPNTGITVCIVVRVYVCMCVCYLYVNVTTSFIFSLACFVSHSGR